MRYPSLGARGTLTMKLIFGAPKTGEARAHLSRAIEINPMSPHVNYLAAKSLLKNDEYEKAEEFLALAKEGGGAQIFSDFLELEKAIKIKNKGFEEG